MEVWEWNPEIVFTADDPAKFKFQIIVLLRTAFFENKVMNFAYLAPLLKKPVGGLQRNP